MSTRVEKANETRFKVAYLRINLGLSLKEIADRLRMNAHTVEYFWRMARLTISGR